MKKIREDFEKLTPPIACYKTAWRFYLEGRESIRHELDRKSLVKRIIKVLRKK